MTAYFIIIVCFAAVFMLLAYERAPSVRTFKQALKGILMATAFAIGVAFLLSEAKADWLPYTEVFIGVEQPTLDVSPQCKAGMGDTKWTSNLGLEQGIWRNDRTSVYLKYQHHSCAIGYDDRVTDSFGIGVKYRVEWK